MDRIQINCGLWIYYGKQGTSLIVKLKGYLFFRKKGKMRATFAFLLLVLAVQISVGKRDANWKFLEKFIVKSRTFDKEKLPSNFKHRFLRGRGSQPGLSAASIEDAVVELLKENQAPIQPNQHRVSKRVKSNCTENILIKSQ